MPDPIQLAAQWAAQEFAAGLSSSLEGMSGARPEHTVEPSEIPSAELRWLQKLGTLPEGIYLAGTDADVLAVGQNVMLSAGIDDSSPEELKSTFQEVLGQAVSLLGRAITSRLQREVTPTGLQAIADLPDGLQWFAAKITLDSNPVSIHIGMPHATAEQLVEPVPQAAAAAAAATGAPALPAPTNAEAAVPESKTFDLLLDVELPVSVSFGHAHLPLRDVLKLTTGSIVELSRAVVEPVDVVVNNCVIAKGEVVVVEGNFGVRIQHVVSRNERLRTLQ